MTFWTAPIRWLGARTTAFAVAATVVGLLLLTFAFPMVWSAPVQEVGQAGTCVRDPSATACDSRDAFDAIALTFLAPALAVAGAFLLGAGLAALIRPRGRLAPEGERLLADATQYVAAGALSVEAFQATRDRLRGHAARRDAPQAALALLLTGFLLGLAAFVLTLFALDMIGWLHGANAARAPLATVARNLGVAAAAASVAGTVFIFREAGRLRRNARGEAERTATMLRDLETDVLDEVRHAHAQRRAEAAPAAEPTAWRPVP